jgi:hypothetical protein
MSEEQAKKPERSLSSKNEIAKLKAQVENLTNMVLKLSTLTGNQALAKQFDLEPYEYHKKDLKRRC